MGLAVIGAGFGRTGTLSLRDALDELGFGPCYHMTEVFERPAHIEVWHAAARGERVDWGEFLGDYGSIVDWPGCAFWPALLEANREAKVVLSVRDAAAWHRSVCNTIANTMTMELPAGAPDFLRPFQAMVRELIWEQTFGGKLLDAEHATSVYEVHNAAVERDVPPDRLVVYELGSGWGPLCEALGVPVPDVPYPRTNSTAEYRQRAGLPPV